GFLAQFTEPRREHRLAHEADAATVTVVRRVIDPRELARECRELTVRIAGPDRIAEKRMRQREPFEGHHGEAMGVGERVDGPSPADEFWRPIAGSVEGARGRCAVETEIVGVD